MERLSRAKFDAGLPAARSRGTQCDDLSIGEAAYGCWSAPGTYGAVLAYVHGVMIVVEVNGASPDQPAATRALAQFAASRY